MKQNSNSGFTLVELAIVLMIIGLLIAGILRGQEMMNNARLQNVIKQSMSYQAALVTFQDMYHSFPGDMSAASNKIPGCQAGNANSCRNGNGDNTIGTPNLVWILNDQSINSENTQFWKHMALSHLISGVIPSASVVGFGQTHPATPIGGGYSVVTTVRDPTDPTGSMIDGSIVLRLHKDLINTNIEQESVMTPQQAGYIDRKMDDGVPNSGSVQSTAPGSAGGKQVDCEVAYNAANTDVICTMSFLMNR